MLLVDPDVVDFSELGEKLHQLIVSAVVGKVADKELLTIPDKKTVTENGRTEAAIITRYSCPDPSPPLLTS